MDEKKHQKAVLYMNSLRERAERLQEEAKCWKINPHRRKAIKKIGFPLDFFSKKELSEREKRKLLNLIRRELVSFKKHFSSVCRVVQKNPMVWNRKVKETEKRLEEALSFYEKVAPFLFQGK